MEFTDLLERAGLDPAKVRLLRHQTKAPNGRTPYILWRDKLSAFEDYQSVQTSGNPSGLAAPAWAAFVAPPTGGTLFVGIYAAKLVGEVGPEWIDPLHDVPGTDLTSDRPDRYDTALTTDLAEYIGRLWIEWGTGARRWVQRPDNQRKAIVELTRTFREDAFPGFTHFITNVSQVQSLLATWIAALRSVRGVYLLSSAKTREQYVGSATGEGGFYGRWLNYAADGHSGNIGLKSSEPSDYQVSILEVSGSATSQDEIVAIEQLWKRKLQSREMGLNRN